MSTRTTEILFGGTDGWQPELWTASDDRVRGGSSQSYLDIEGSTAVFRGNLDTKTLGGAGFASQRTKGDDRHWDFSGSDGIELLINSTRSDDKRYTFILKDELLPRNPENGREQSTTSWEYDFDVQNAQATCDDEDLISIVIQWKKLKPTYRGKEKDPGRPFLISDVRRISIMMRSFFGEQEGDFSLCLNRIGLICVEDPKLVEDVADTRSGSNSSSNMDDLKTPSTPNAGSRQPSLWRRFFSQCGRL